MLYEKIAYLLLRLGVAFAFLYPALSAYLEPYTWLGYFPPFVHTLAAQVGLDEVLMLHLFGVVEIVIALWILSGKKIFYPSLLAGLMLLLIVGFNLEEFPILFRDLSIAAMAFYLALLSHKNWPR